MVYTLPAIDTVLAYCLSLLILLRKRAEWSPISEDDELRPYSFLKLASKLLNSGYGS